MFVQKIECANHACKAYRSRLEELAKDHPQFRGKGGLTKKAIQRLTVGARIAIRTHSKTRDLIKLRHDLRNGPHHVFGDHVSCSPQFCKYSPINNSSLEDENESDAESTCTSGCMSTTEDDNQLTFNDRIDTIIRHEENEQEEIEGIEEDARNGYQSSLDSLPEGLFVKVQACGDRLVMLAGQLIDNETSNLAECYMSIRACFDGGKQYNRIQSGAFEHRCYSAGLRMQNGPRWLGDTLQLVTGEQTGKVRKIEYSNYHALLSRM